MVSKHQFEQGAEGKKYLNLSPMSAICGKLEPLHIFPALFDYPNQSFKSAFYSLINEECVLFFSCNHKSDLEGCLLTLMGVLKRTLEKG